MRLIWTATVFSLCLSAQTNPAVDLIRTNCSMCHNQQMRSSGLALDNRADAIRGGNRGPAVKPGAPGESVLVKAVEQTGDLKMPPGRKLSDEQIGIIRTWIEQGMVWPEPAQSQAAK